MGLPSLKNQPKLTYKQQLFVNEYIVDGNATRAAIAAGYNKKSARKMGCENVTKPDIQAAIEKARNLSARRINKTSDMVMADIEETRLQALEAGQYSAATRCSELQGKHLAMFTDKVQHSGSISVDELSPTVRDHRINYLLNKSVEARARENGESEYMDLMNGTTRKVGNLKH